MNLPRWSLRNPTVVLLLTLGFTAWGVLTILSISRREDPEIRIATALVVSIYPGAGARKVEEQITRELEDAIETMDTLEELTSTSRENLSVIFVTVRYDADTDMEWQKLRSIVEETAPRLPETVRGPDVWDDFGDTTAMIVALTGADGIALEDVAEDLEAELRRVESVGEVTIHGEVVEVVYVEGTTSDMARHGITPTAMAQALEMRNVQIPGGSVRTGRFSYRVEPTGAFESARDVEDSIIAISDETGQPLHVRDVFSVRRVPSDPPEAKVIANGERCVALGVVMKEGHNVVAMGRHVREVLASFRPRLPAGVEMEVLHDSPRQVREQVNGFLLNLLEALGIVVVVMALLMGIRAALLSATAIPLSVLVALAVMPLMDTDLEMVSIAAFIVVLGMLVDNSIIVIDNVDRRIREGLPCREAAWRGAHELGVPVLVGTLATAIAFLPMLLLSDEVGGYVRSLPLVVTVSLLASLAISLTLTPIMASRLMGRGRRPPTSGSGDGRTDGLPARLYRRFMEACLRARWLVILLSVAALAGAGALLVHVGFSFFPDADRDQFVVDVWLREGSAIEETERVGRRAERDLREDPRVDSTLLFVGEGGPRFYITVTPEFQKTNYARIMVNAVSASATREVVRDFNREAARRYPGARVRAEKLVMGMPVEAPVAFRIQGDDLDRLRGISRRVQDVLRTIPGAVNVRDNMGLDVPSLSIEVDEEMANRVGVTNTDVALAFLSTYQGFELTSFRDGDDAIPVVLRLSDVDRELREGLADLPVASALTGVKVPLGSIAEVVPSWSPGVIKRVDNRRTVTVMASTRGRLAGDIVAEALPRIREIRMPPGTRISVAGEKKEMDRAFRDLLVVFGVILASLTLLLVLQLRSLRKAFVVLAVVPLSAVGASIGLALGGFSFSFMAFIGVVSLAGMVIKNSVVWVEFVERARASGSSQRRSVIEAGLLRLRPIALTAVTTAGGLLPLAVFGGVLFEPMAWAMIGGLVLATALTLVVVPVLYVLLVPERT